MPAPKPSAGHFKKIGHDDYRHWADVYGWTPDETQKERQQKNNRNRKQKRRLDLHSKGYVKSAVHQKNPRLAAMANAMVYRARKRAAFLEIVPNCGFAGLNAILSTFPNVSEVVNDAA